MNYNFYRIGLIVTGEGEEKFLEHLFRTIMSRAYCKFEIIRRFPQISPLTSPKKLLNVTGTDRRVNSRDEELGLSALGYLRKHPKSFVLVIDDLEGDRRNIAVQVFRRYRTALDSVLTTCGYADRASIHFLVNMLEAYYFADAKAVNLVAKYNLLMSDYPTDVENISHPKKQLRAIWSDFHEIDHGDKIVRSLDLEHVLSRPEECCWLRSLFSWCVEKLRSKGAIHDPTLTLAFCSAQGSKEPITYSQ